MDRFPQLPNGGAPKLPESLWVLAEPAYLGTRKSTAPVLPEQRLTLADPTALPAFATNETSTLAEDPNPILSHPVCREHTCFNIMMPGQFVCGTPGLSRPLTTSSNYSIRSLAS